MHRTLFLTSLLLLSTGSLLEAQNAQFPYDAEIVAAEAYVRSGPGKKYYPTSILKRKDRVVVRRHDPGGWYMIDPPAGSFSWVRADYIEKNGNVGTVTETNVVARVGSAVNPDSKEVEQIRLSQGDEVQILGEKTFNIDGKSIPFYKIYPPRFEYRWIMGQFLTPVDSSLRKERAANPFDAPPTSDLTDDSIPASKASQQVSESDQPAQLDKRILDPEESADDIATSDDSVDRVTQKTGEQAKPNPSELQPDEIDHLTDEQKLELIDEQFREMVKQQPTFWNLDKLEQGYEQIQQETDRSAVARQIAARLDAVDRYRKTQEQYDEFIRISKEASERDAQLLAMQQSLSGNAQPNPAANAPEPAPSNAVVPNPGTSEPQFLPPRTPSTANTTTKTPAPVANSLIPANQADANPAGSNPVSNTSSSIEQRSPTTPAPAASDKPPRRFDGAGVVQRAAATIAGAPRYVLLAPNGRILAYLQPEQGINLEEHLGQSRGVIGKRGYDNALKADLIHVRQLVAVRLQTSTPTPSP